MHKYIMEFIGTFFLVLGIGITSDPLIIGLFLAGLIYIGADVSGAHYNPAVSLSFLLQRKLAAHEFIGYVVSQILAAAVGALVVFYLTGAHFFIEPAATANELQIILIEVLLTFVLAFVIIVISSAKSLKGTHIHGLAIGLTLTALIATGSPISGGVFNPAVFIGFSVLDAFQEGTSYQLIPLYTISALLGGAVASMALNYFRRQSPKTF